MGVLPVVRVAAMTPDELEQRIQSIAPDDEVRVTDWLVCIPPSVDGVRVVARVSGVRWAEAHGRGIEEACDIAWSRVIVRLCDEVERAKAALERARAFEREMG